MEDIQFMQLAIALAKKGKGHVNPNPLVGAVLVKDGTIIGKGYHEQYGQLHAERNALKDCKVSPEGAVLLCHVRTVQSSWKDTAMYGGDYREWDCKGCNRNIDPNPQMAGKSVKILQEHGIEVVVGMLEEECKDLIRVFRKYITTGGICIDEICHDHGWKDCNLYRSIQMDYRGKGACLCAGDAQ